jgi:large subunit ribosomal protein L25
MADDIIVKAIKREAKGSGTARRLRNAGQIPAVVYGNTENLSIQLDGHDFGLLLRDRGQNFVADLDVEGDAKQKVLLKDVQYNPISSNIMHADFVSISMTEALHVSLPVELLGEPAGVVAGGLLEQLISEVEIECLPGDMIEKISVDVSALEIGDHLTVSDLPLPTGITLLTDADVAVANVAAPRVQDEADDTAGEPAAEGEAEAAAEAETTPEA